MRHGGWAFRPGAWALAALLCVALAVPAPAAGRLGSVTVRACPPAEDIPALAGDEYSLAQVAAGTENYVWDDGFQSLAPAEDWDSLTDSRRMALAAEMADLAGEKDLYTAAAPADEAGTVTFSGLEPGLYLLARTAPAAENAGYAAAPLLINLPCPTAEGPVYDVTVDMKFALAADSTPDPDAGEPAERLLQTGQLNWPIPILAGAGVCLFLAGTALYREAREDEEKKKNG